MTFACLVILLAGFAGCSSPDEKDAPVIRAELTADEIVVGFEQMCAHSRPTMEARQAAATLFERVGGREGIRVVVEDTVRRHLVNEQIKHLMEGVDTQALVAQVTDLLVVGAGGEEHPGLDRATAYAHLELSNADFLAASSDLRDAMEGAGWGEDEHQELLCAFVALRGDVVTR